MSTQRSFAVPKTLPTNIFLPSVMSYYDGDNNLPVPFTMKNGVLDIAIQDNVRTKLLTAATFIFPDSYVDVQASIMGGLSLVTSLGPNMLIFLKNFINAQEDIATNDLTEDITIHTAATMTKLSFNDINSWTLTYQFTNEEPIVSGYDLVSRRPNSVAWMFKSPLVIKYKYDGDVKYLTLVSSTSQYC